MIISIRSAKIACCGLNSGLSCCLKFNRRTMASLAAASGCSQWRPLRCDKMELRIDITLDCGQSFRWHETSQGIWTGVMSGRVWTLMQTDHELLYQVYEPEHATKNCSQLITQTKLKHSGRKPETQVDGVAEAQGGMTDCSFDSSSAENTSTYCDLLQSYFQLDYSLDKLYTEFSERDENFKKKASHFKGVRLLRQDPVETLFSFICSSNNNINRISGMIERMCQHFGEKIVQLGGMEYYAFPSVERLACDDVEEVLRKLGFGYRAKFIMESAKMVLAKGGSEYLTNLRSADYESAKASLMKLQGVGAKVADCICLMSLDKVTAIPVDTHVKQIAERDYSLLLGTKSCTTAVYNRIGEHFRNLWGPFAGWAQCVLFASDLKKFKDSAASKTRITDDTNTDLQTGSKRRKPLPL